MGVQILQLTPMQIFEKQWQAYQKLLTGDYLEHRDLYAALKDLITKKAAEGPLSLADLGCGDSDYISRTLREAGGTNAVSSYTGVDLSEPAIDISKRNIAKALGPGAGTAWHQQDFLSFACNCQQDFDCILMSFALHHLKANDKAELVKQAHRLLERRQGVFVMIDLLLAPGESLEEYQKRSQADVSGNWITLSKDEHASFRDHMLKYDHPEELSTLQRMGQAAGFASVDSMFEASKGLSAVVVFQS